MNNLTTMKKVLKEWFIEAPWGKIALISWGNSKGEPVLLVHGRQDSASTFIPLLELLPDDYHYVAVEMPGNGLSDPFPIGVRLTRIYPVVVIDIIVKHMQWKEFIYIAHSMGAEQGLFYNAVFPGKLKKFIFLDGAPAIQRLLRTDFQAFYEKYFINYYDNYDKYNTDDRVYSKQSAINAVMRARHLTQEQAELILSRNLIKIGDDKYKLSWDKRQKSLAPTFNSVDFYYDLFSLNAPPTLHISAKPSTDYPQGKYAVAELMAALEKNVENFRVVTVEGTHDVHFTNPERLAGAVTAFLREDFPKKTKSKL